MNTTINWWKCFCCVREGLVGQSPSLDFGKWNDIFISYGLSGYVTPKRRCHES